MSYIVEAREEDENACPRGVVCMRTVYKVKRDLIKKYHALLEVSCLPRTLLYPVETPCFGASSPRVMRCVV